MYCLSLFPHSEMEHLIGRTTESHFMSRLKRIMVHRFSIDERKEGTALVVKNRIHNDVDRGATLFIEKLTCFALVALMSAIVHSSQSSWISNL